MIREKVEGRKVYNIVYISLIIIVLLSLIWIDSISIFLHLKPNYMFSNDTEIHVIDVGQGDAIGVKFDNGQSMLIDSGIKESKKKLFRYLDKVLLSDSKVINYFVLTHIDNDHSGNLIDILDKYHILNLYLPKLDCENKNLPYYALEMYGAIINKATSMDINIFYNEAGTKLKIGETDLIWLAPLLIDGDIDSNDYSPVIRLNYNGKSALFTGDIGSNIESDLMNKYSQDSLDVDILKIAHHGSASSTSLDFLNITTPEFACISVGENTYGHPSNELISRILEYDSAGYDLYNNLLTTKECGNIIFVLGNSVYTNTIANIDNYLFVSYVWFCVIGIVFILCFMLLPYYKALRKNIRFIVQNRRYEKNKVNEK